MTEANTHRMPITERDFYSLFPDGYHATGDIWMGLPSLGLVSADRVSGLVVTPACDLANCKARTMTYVPIVSVSEFLRMSEFTAEVEKFVLEGCDSFGIRNSILPNIDYRWIESQLEATTPLKAKCDLHRRCMRGVKFLGGQIEPGTKTSAIVADVLGAQWRRIRERLVRNAYRSDIYYLPPDGQTVDWSPIPSHSVALLRYLITVPTQFFDEAYAADLRDWGSRRQRLIENRMYWCRHCDEAFPPLRALRLREAFLSDLLTKLVSIYVRIGAPDLDHTCLSKIEQEL